MERKTAGVQEVSLSDGAGKLQVCNIESILLRFELSKRSSDVELAPLTVCVDSSLSRSIRHGDIPLLLVTWSSTKDKRNNHVSRTS